MDDDCVDDLLSSSSSDDDDDSDNDDGSSSSNAESGSNSDSEPEADCLDSTELRGQESWATMVAAQKTSRGSVACVLCVCGWWW